MALSEAVNCDGPPTADGWTFAEDEVLRRWPYAVAGAEEILGFGSVSVVLYQYVETCQRLRRMVEPVCRCDYSDSIGYSGFMSIPCQD